MIARALSGVTQSMDFLRGMLTPRADSWLNAITGLGGVRDKRTGSRWNFEAPIDQLTLQGLYNNNDLAARICDAPVEDATREGFTIAEDADGSLLAACERWEVLARVTEAAIWGRAFGAGFVLVGVAGQDPTTPLGAIPPGGLLYLESLDRFAVEPIAWYENPRDPKFGKPAKYQLTTLGDGPVATDRVGATVHESRLIRFDGARTTALFRRMNNGFDASVLQRVYPVIRDYDGNWASVGHLMASLSQAVYKVAGLMDMISEGQHDVMVRRMELVDMARSVARAIIVDAEAEDFSQVGAANVTGAGDILEKSAQRLAAAARMPATVLFGMSPSGLNATGESDIRGWYDFVSQTQGRMAHGLRRLVEIVAAHEGIAAPADGWSIDWPSLWQPSPTESAEIRKITAETDAIEIASGVLDPAEVAIARYGRGEWSAETASVVVEGLERRREELADVNAGAPAEAAPEAPEAAPEAPEAPEGGA